jgi:hypothetical protein
MRPAALVAVLRGILVTSELRMFWPAVSVMNATRGLIEVF